MHIEKIGDNNIVVYEAKDKVIACLQDGIDLLGSGTWSEADLYLLQKESFAPEFYDLKTGLAGDILQKFSNYRVRSAIVGDFGSVPQRFQEFIRECNNGNQLRFMDNLDEAKVWLTSS